MAESNNNKRRFVQKHDRKLDRAVAHNRMRMAGMTQVNKNKSDNGSYFANNWRSWSNN